MTIVNILEILKIIVMTSVLFVWVIRYENIVTEFKQYGLPAWLRDLVGILKISFVIMLMNENANVVLLGSGGIVALMLAALFTHFCVSNPFNKMIPALTLMSFSLVIFITTL